MSCAVILARGGSKQIPKKNIIDILGYPMIYYSISAAKACDRIIVSTDSDEIGEIAKSYKAEYFKRDPKYAQDTSSSEDALLEVCESINDDVIVFIQPTSPLLLHTDIESALNIFNQNSYDSLFSCYKEHWLPRWTDSSEYLWDKNSRPRRQDVQELYVENGAFYISKRKNILESKLRYSGKIGKYIMPYSRSFQVDTEDDLFIIRAILKEGCI